MQRFRCLEIFSKDIPKAFSNAKEAVIVVVIFKKAIEGGDQ